MPPRVLIADASPVTRRIVEMTCAPEGIVVLGADDGVRALDVIRNERPDVVLADHALPGRSGYDLADALRSDPDLSGTPVLLLAGAFEHVDETRARAAGCAGILMKPLEPAVVVARVRALAGDRPATPVEPSPPADGQPEPAAASEPEVESASRASPDPEPLSMTNDAAAGAEATSGLDDYLARVDAALKAGAARDAAAPDAVAPAPAAGDADEPEVPTLDRVLGGMEAESEAVGESRAEAHANDPLADALRSFLDVAPETAPATPAAPTGAAPAPGTVDEQLVEAIARRVLERLSPGAADAVVGEVVTRVAERLVRDELADRKARVPDPPS